MTRMMKKLTRLELTPRIPVQLLEWVDLEGRKRRREVSNHLVLERNRRLPSHKRLEVSIEKQQISICVDKKASRRKTLSS